MSEVSNVREASLAWALIDEAKPHMNAGERNYAIVAVGAGDTFAAIRQILNLVAAKRIPLPANLVQRCIRWLDAYALHQEHEHLRRLIEGFMIMDTRRASAADIRPSAMPKREAPRAVTGPIHMGPLAGTRPEALPAARSLRKGA